MTDYSNAEAVLLRSILSGKKEVANRQTLGPMVPIQLFQALRLIGMGSSIEDMVGEGAHALVYQSGKRVGQTLGNAVLPQAGKDLPKYLELIRNVCLQLSIGQLALVKADNNAGPLDAQGRRVRLVRRHLRRQGAHLQLRSGAGGRRRAACSSRARSGASKSNAMPSAIAPAPSTRTSSVERKETSNMALDGD